MNDSLRIANNMTRGSEKTNRKQKGNRSGRVDNGNQNRDPLRSTANQGFAKDLPKEIVGSVLMNVSQKPTRLLLAEDSASKSAIVFSITAFIIGPLYSEDGLTSPSRGEDGLISLRAPEKRKTSREKSRQVIFPLASRI